MNFVEIEHDFWEDLDEPVLAPSQLNDYGNVSVRLRV